MTLYFYPPDLRQQFVNRERELRQLEHYLDQLRRGQPTHVALFGLRRIGKTLLLKELIARLLEPGDDVIPIYMDLSESCGSPEHFHLYRPHCLLVSHPGPGSAATLL